MKTMNALNILQSYIYQSIRCLETKYLYCIDMSVSNWILINQTELQDKNCGVVLLIVEKHGI